MKISTEIMSAARHLGEEKAIEYLAKAGFDAWDFSMFSMCQYNWETQRLIENSHPLSGKAYLTFAKKDVYKRQPSWTEFTLPHNTRMVH